MITRELKIGEQILYLETGRMAKQADASVVARYGDTMVLATAVSDREPLERVHFLPLMVEYRERQYGAGKIPGGFFKREGRPSEKETLSARLTDRAIRPLFPKGYKHETQVIIYIISSDQENDADTLGTIAASAALTISDIPFKGPIASVRIGQIDGELRLNPPIPQLEESTMDIIISGGKDSIVMVEGKASEIPESRIIEALNFGHESIRKIVDTINDLASECGKTKRDVEEEKIEPDLIDDVKNLVWDKIRTTNRSFDLNKHEREDAKKKYIEETLSSLDDRYEEKEDTIKDIIKELQKDDLREMMLSEGKRLDGRTSEDIRQITCEVGVLPRAHGSSLFTRGETQSLTAATLGTKMDEQKIDGVDGERWNNYMLHYNFPPFSVGEVKFIRGASRREIGHGKLAERALESVLPSDEDFPYTLRLVSDILESNGSSSMATVCAGSLALMDAGVAISKPVAGIAMGLITDGKNTQIISDILGTEDHLGDMDFKLAGTRDGVTAIQMDLKIDGISIDTISSAIDQAKSGRVYILDKMDECISEARQDISQYAPRILSLKVPVEMIGEIIGPGGKNIKKISSDTGAKIEIDDDGTVLVSSIGGEAALAAKDIIYQMTRVPEIGEEFDAVVKKIMPFGAFVEFLPGKEGLVHISELEYKRVEKVEDVAQLGDKMRVKLIGVTNEGKFDLSRKILLEKPEGWEERPRRSDRRPPRRDGGRRGGFRRDKGRDRDNR